MFERAQLIFTQSRGCCLSLPAVCGIQQDLSFFNTLTVCSGSSRIQYEGLEGLFLELHLHTKQNFDFFMWEVGKLIEILGWSGIKFSGKQNPCLE